MLISAPEVPGYITKQTYSGGECVAADECNREYTVKYTINAQPSTDEQKVIIKYVDLGNNNQEITTDTVVGQPNSMVDYKPDQTIVDLMAIILMARFNSLVIVMITSPFLLLR